MSIGAPQRLSDADFTAIAQLLHQATGIRLADNKRDLVVGRLNRRLRTLGLGDFSAYRAYLASPEGEEERGEMINALTTNLTSFFREKHHFAYLGETVLPELLRGETGRLRLWSAACSSGEEPYSMAMVLNKALAGKPRHDAKILATDIDTNMIATAIAGQYGDDRGAAIPAEFDRMIRREPGGRVEMGEALRARITFKQLNLMGDWPMKGPFDVVFCRNVVIYFDKPTQRKLFDRIAEMMTPQGWLFIGHSENLFGVCDRFKNLGRTIYRKLA